MLAWLTLGTGSAHVGAWSVDTGHGRVGGTKGVTFAFIYVRATSGIGSVGFPALQSF